MGFRSNLKMKLAGCKTANRNVNVLGGGQAVNYAILQMAHRLEKGLCVRNPKALWGFDKAMRLVDLLCAEEKKSKGDLQAVRIGKAVLSAYISAKEQCEAQAEKDKLAALKKKIEEKGLRFENNTDGGALTVNHADVAFDKSEMAIIERLFNTRHSVRDFADTPVDMEKLKYAVSLALRAPSACNRQATKVYVISGEQRAKAGGGNEYYADKYLIICGCMSAYSLSEMNDWIVSSAIFSGYLSLALHSVGIGSCCFRKALVGKSQFNDNIRALCHIPENEQIVLEMAIGNYKDEFVVPVSQRRLPEDVIVVSDGQPK